LDADELDLIERRRMAAPKDRATFDKVTDAILPGKKDSAAQAA
jgi:hypothetical protein